MKRYIFLSLAVVLMVCLAWSPFGASIGQGADKTRGKGTGKLVIVGWGGSYQEAQDQAFFQSFTKQTGIQITQGTGPQIERSKAEVESGKPSFDTTTTNQTFYNIGVAENLWEPIDYSYFEPEVIKGMREEVRLKYGVGSIYYAEGMAFNTKAFPDGSPQPNSWADFWDVKKFPGKRALCSPELAAYPLPEIALLADGVSVKDLYPIDMDRAVAKLKKIAPDAVWYKNLNQPGQFLSSQEVVIALAPSGRIQKLIDGGAPLKIVWNQARYTFDVWYVLRGAANKQEAMKFIAFASKPEYQAEMAKLSGNAPTNANAFKYLDEATAKKMVTYPKNFTLTFMKNEDWWKKNRDTWVEKCTAALLQ